MDRTWIMVAHRSGARLFENRGPTKGLDLLDALEHPAGKLKNREIESDKPGRSFDRRGSGRHAYAKEHEATEHVAEQFARQLSDILEQGRNHQKYQRLVLVAEPRFLGMLRGALSPQTGSLVTATLDKDLGGIESRDLPRHLDGVVLL